MAIIEDGSLVDSTETLRHFSRAAFAALAKDLDRCFMCGVSHRDAIFNDEHVIPDWVLRRYSMHSRRITLPNGSTQMYGSYTIRCCKDCNSTLGCDIETPVSRILNGSYQQVCEQLASSPASALYQWLCLLFIKSHLKDREIRFDLDRRNESEQIGDFYDWDGLHHIHSVARAAISHANIEDAVLGTTFIFECHDGPEPFDFGDLSDYSTVSIRLGSVGIACVLNDCGAVGMLVQKFLGGITGPLRSVQLREIAARLAYGNTLLKRRPSFWSELHANDLTIRELPANPWPITATDRDELGKLLVHACEPCLRKSQTPRVDRKLEQLSRCEITFLYHDDGSFISEKD